MTRDNVARVIAIAEMISGGVAAPYVIFSNWHVSVSNTSNHLNVRSDLPGAALLLAVVFAASVYAGYELWRGTKIGYRLSVALIGLQVVQIMLPGFQFQLVCP